MLVEREGIRFGRTRVERRCVRRRDRGGHRLARAIDAAEDSAVHAVFGSATSAGSTKGWTGHVLGAAGITEALICVYALCEQWRPGTLNCITPDPSLRTRIERRSQAAPLRNVLSNSFGFGGNNCSLVFGLHR